MAASQTHNSNGKISKKSKVIEYIRTFFSPLEFYSAYLYWVCLIYYSTYLAYDGLAGRTIKFYEDLCPFTFGCGETVYPLFFIFPVCFVILCAHIIWNIHQKQFVKTKCGLAHMLLIILLTDYVNALVDGLLWVYAFK